MYKIKILIVAIVVSIAIKADINIGTDNWPGGGTYKDGFYYISSTKTAGSSNSRITDVALLIRHSGKINVTNSLTIDNAVIKVETIYSKFLNGYGKPIKIQNSSSLIADLSTRTSSVDMDLKELTGVSSIIEKDNKHFLIIKTPNNAKLSNSYIKGISHIEAGGQFLELYNVDFVNTVYAMYNKGAGRIDRFGVNIPSTSSSWVSRLGNNNSGNNSFYDWNPTNVNFEKIILENANNEYFVGYTASIKFIDKSTENPVADVLVVFKDNRANTSLKPTNKAIFTSKTDGTLQGRKSTKDFSISETATDQDFPILYFITNKSKQDATTIGIDVNGSTITHHNYEIDTVDIQLKVKSYLHQSIPYNFTINSELGKINNDGNSVKEFDNYYLKTDDNISNSNYSNVLSYTTINTTEELYDRSKAEWRNYQGEKDYPLIKAVGGILNMPEGWSLTVDKNAVNPYLVDFTDSIITINSNSLESTTKFNRLVCASGKIKFLNNSNINFPYSDEDRTSYVRIINVDPSDQLSVFDENGNPLFENYNGEFGFAYHQENKKYKIVLDRADGTQAMKFYDLNNPGIENVFSAGFMVSDNLFKTDDRQILYNIQEGVNDSLETNPDLFKNLNSLIKYMNKKVQKRVD